MRARVNYTRGRNSRQGYLRRPPRVKVVNAGLPYGHQHPTLRGMFALCMACMPCTASISHAAWDIGGHLRGSLGAYIIGTLRSFGSRLLESQAIVGPLLRGLIGEVPVIVARRTVD